MRRGTGEWQQYVFKIVGNHLQCLSLKEVSIIIIAMTCKAQEHILILILETVQGD